jgi:hypothetical protein
VTQELLSTENVDSHSSCLALVAHHKLYCVHVRVTITIR